jgi:hypothetical protein
MRIFIDEAGAFLPPTSSPSSYSLVVALVVPASCEKELFYEFLRLRDSWPKQQIEIKGSTLDEAQAAQVIEVLAAFDVVVDFIAADMALHPKNVVEPFKSAQAAAITARLTREYAAELVFELVQLEHKVSEMPNQLFVQAELTIKLIMDVLQIALLYYVQRKPEELGDIAWEIDRKGRSLTVMEEAWSTLILPASESHFMKKPLIFLKEADYSHFARYETDLAIDAEMARHTEWLAAAYGKPEVAQKGRVVNSTRLLTEQRTFADSLSSLGLQLADTVASILRRALNGNLQESGWKNIGKLVVEQSQPGWLSRLGPETATPPFPQTVVDVWNQLKALAKPMLLDQAPTVHGEKPEKTAEK